MRVEFCCGGCLRFFFSCRVNKMKEEGSYEYERNSWFLWFQSSVDWGSMFMVAGGGMVEEFVLSGRVT